MFDADDERAGREIEIMTRFIERNADSYVDKRLRPLTAPDPDDAGPPPTEADALEHLSLTVEKLVIDYGRSTVPLRGDALVFAEIYGTVVTSAPDEAPGAHDPLRSAVHALLGLEVEFRGYRRPSVTQNSTMAGLYEKLGARFTEAGLHAHAALAYTRASYCHGLAENFTEQDRCRLARARARRRGTGSVVGRIPGWISDALCGYGFRPFLLLLWIAVQLVLFTCLLLAFERLSFGQAAQLCLTNYLNPVGMGDLDTLDVGGAGRVLLAVEAWTGIVFLSVFFALLVRRWFRY